MKICICGYTGKTGSKVYELLKDNNYDVYGVDLDNPNIENIKQFDLLIDFTNKESSLNYIQQCISNRVDFIVGTTGFLKDELEKIKYDCQKSNVKGIICYNFSLPVNYLLNSFRFFNEYFENFLYFDVHHISKLDKISGTTNLFSNKNSKIIVKSIKSKKNTISYIIQMTSKYDKMNITYQVNDKKAFALGILYYLKTNNEDYIENLIG